LLLLFSDNIGVQFKLFVLLQFFQQLIFQLHFQIFNYSLFLELVF